MRAFRHKVNFGSHSEQSISLNSQKVKHGRDSCNTVNHSASTGKKNSDWEQGLQHAADWARDVQHTRKAYPELDQKLTLFLKQCSAPGALPTLDALIQGKGKPPLDEDLLTERPLLLSCPVGN